MLCAFSIVYQISPLLVNTWLVPLFPTLSTVERDHLVILKSCWIWSFTCHSPLPLGDLGRSQDSTDAFHAEDKALALVCASSPGPALSQTSLLQLWNWPCSLLPPSSAQLGFPNKRFTWRRYMETLRSLSDSPRCEAPVACDFILSLIFQGGKQTQYFFLCNSLAYVLPFYSDCYYLVQVLVNSSLDIFNKNI